MVYKSLNKWLLLEVDMIFYLLHFDCRAAIFCFSLIGIILFGLLEMFPPFYWHIVSMTCNL